MCQNLVIFKLKQKKAAKIYKRITKQAGAELGQAQVLVLVGANVEVEIVIEV